MKINPEFANLIPPLAPEEYAQLEANIVANGCRDPLVVWGDTLIDGHNRFEICGRNKIEFKTTNLKFADESEAQVWIIRNQFGRRNLTLAARCELAEALASKLRPKAKENQIARKGKQAGAKSVKIDEVDARERAAKEAGVSAGSMSAYKFVKANGDAATIQNLLTNPNAKIHRVAKDIKEKKDRELDSLE